MKIIFSRKGFDSGSGGCPSPICDGVPVSLPIPSGPSEPYRFNNVVHPSAGNLGPIVAALPKKINPSRYCHFDPQLPWDMGAANLGQQGTAQSHLANQNVGPGDVFIFFGLFKDYVGPTDPRAIIENGPPHQRIFGIMTIEEIVDIGPDPQGFQHYGLPRTHPHTNRGQERENNTLYKGRGQLAHNAYNSLKLSAEGQNLSVWNCPEWLQKSGLSYHGREDRWQGNLLHTVARGQEFVADVGDCPDAAAWLKYILEEMNVPA